MKDDKDRLREPDADEAETISDLRTALTVASGYVQLLHRRLTKTEIDRDQLRETAMKAREQIGRLERVLSRYFGEGWTGRRREADD